MCLSNICKCSCKNLFEHIGILYTVILLYIIHEQRYLSNIIVLRVACAYVHDQSDQIYGITCAMVINKSFIHGEICCQCLTRYPWPFYKCKAPECYNMSCADCNNANSGFCGMGAGACNGPDREDYLKRCTKRPAAAMTKSSKESRRKRMKKN